MKRVCCLFLLLLCVPAVLGACGSPRVVVVTATPSPAPAITYVVVTPEPPTPTPTPSPTPMPEAERVPVLSPLEVSEEAPGGHMTYFIKILFSDADGDANLVDWEILSSTNQDVQVDDGTIEANAVVQKYGTSVSGTWECGDEEYLVALQITIGDAAGHVSAPQQVTLHCPGIEPTVTPTPSVTPMPVDTPTPEPTWTPWPTEPPPGPAKVRGSLPSTVPCTPISGGECEWDWTITFTNDSGTNGTIGQISIEYIERDGEVWVRGGGQWSTETIVVWAHGTETYDSWVRSEAGNECELRGATVRVGWKGKDALGNPFSGSTSAVLEPEP